MSAGETGLLVLQPTPFCNIDCTYCYLPNRTSTKRMTFELAENILKKVLAFPTIRDRLTIVWHAGEPLVLPVSYYEHLFDLIASIAPAGLEISHSIQTNGTLITPAWCEFIKKRNISIGVSIDGPRDLHDLHRKQRNGAGSFDKTYAGMKQLREAGIPFHVITVLTMQSMAHPERMLDFYEENDISYVCFNIEEQEGANSQSTLVGSQGSDEKYGAFLTRFLDASMTRKHPILVREIEHCFRAIHMHGEPFLNAQTEPFHIISIDCEGNLSTFSPELLGLEHERYASFCFGNVLHDSFEEISERVLGSDVCRDVAAGVQACANTCEYFGLCGGGAPSNKIFENGSAATTETVYCKSFKRTVDLVLDLLERLPADLAASHRNASGSPGAPAASMWPG